MPIDVGLERLISLGEAATRLGINYRTAWVYARGGGVKRAGGLKLETVRIGRVFKTSLEALQRFSAELERVDRAAGAGR